MEKKIIKNKKTINKVKKFSNVKIPEKNNLDDSIKFSEEIDSLKKELSEEKDNYLRLYAEFDNYKKRVLKERMELMLSANIDTINGILPVLDDMDIVKKKIECTDENKGFFLIMEKMFNVMKNKGLEEITVNKGDSFDVDSHEAITTISVEEEDMDGKIYDVISKGYKLNGKVIRYSKVVIAQKK